VHFNEIRESSPNQTRGVIFDPEGCPKDKELLDSISAVGITTPITVRKLRDSKSSRTLLPDQGQGERRFAIVNGHRRVAAGKAAGLPGVHAIILNPDADHELITLAENQGRKDLTSFETAHSLHNFKERRKYSGRQVAEVTGYSRTHVNRLLNARKAPKPLLKLWEEGRISATALVNLKDHWSELSQPQNKECLVRIKSLSQNDSQILADQLSTGTSLAQSLEVITAINDASRSKPTSTSTGKKDNLAAETEQKLPVEKKTFKSSEKESVIQLARNIYPRIKPEKINALFDLAIANNEKRLDVFLAAVHYVSRGGDVNNAIPDSQDALKDRSFRALMKREIKNMKQAAALYKTKKQKKTLKKTIRICFPGI
jgi:ParB/RepB/Spo0J family partition protein